MKYRKHQQLQLPAQFHQLITQNKQVIPGKINTISSRKCRTAASSHLHIACARRRAKGHFAAWRHVEEKVFGPPFRPPLLLHSVDPPLSSMRKPNHSPPPPPNVYSERTWPVFGGEYLFPFIRMRHMLHLCPGCVPLPCNFHSICPAAVMNILIGVGTIDGDMWGRRRFLGNFGRVTLWGELDI